MFQAVYWKMERITFMVQFRDAIAFYTFFFVSVELIQIVNNRTIGCLTDYILL